MTGYTEADLAEALRDVQSGTSYRKAAEKWGIPTTTLYSLSKGSVPRREAHTHTQRLSVTQETALVNWILAQADLGLALTHLQIKHFVRRILASGGDNRPLGKRWMDGFFERNPTAKTIRGSIRPPQNHSYSGHSPRTPV